MFYACLILLYVFISGMLCNAVIRNKRIQSILRELHWLPVRRRVDFKLATFMYKTLHSQIPRYLSGNCQLISDASRRLRSSNTFTFAVPRTRTRLGDRSFAVAGPQIWNSLPADLRLVDNSYYARFRRLLKGHVWLRLRRPVTLLFLGAVYKYTYLLL